MDVYSDRNQIRMLAMGMLDAGSTQKKVALDLGFNISTIRRWWVKFKSGETLQHRKGAGRPKCLSRISKIIITKSLNKRHHSVRRLSKRLKSKGISVSKNTIYRYLRNEKCVKPFKRQKKETKQIEILYG